MQIKAPKLKFDANRHQVTHTKIIKNKITFQKLYKLSELSEQTSVKMVHFKMSNYSKNCHWRKNPDNSCKVLRGFFKLVPAGWRY